MKKIYVFSPVRGDQNNPLEIKNNIARAVMYSRFVYSQGHLPICPHIYLENATGLKSEAENPDNRRELLDLGLEMLTLCDELWVFGRRFGDESSGMRKEVVKALEKGMHVEYRNEFLPKL